MTTSALVTRLQRQIDDQADQINQLWHALRNMIRTGTVDEYDPETDRAIASDQTEGDSDDGRVTTPPARVLGQSGAVTKRSTVSAGEQVLILSSGGQVGNTSLIVPLGPNPANPSPSNHSEEDYTSVGETSVRMRTDSYEVTTRAAVVKAETALIDAQVDLGAKDGPAVARVGDKVLITAGSSAGLWPIVTGASLTRAS